MAATPRPWKDRRRFDADRASIADRAECLARFVAAEHAIPFGKFTGPLRIGRLTRVRAAFVWVARQGIASPLIKGGGDRAASYPILARVIGRNDHSTAINLFQRAEIYRARNAVFRAKTDRLLDIVLAGRVPTVPRMADESFMVPRGPALEPFKLAACRKTKNDLSPDDDDAMSRMRASNRFMVALRRAHPERCAA